MEEFDIVSYLRALQQGLKKTSDFVFCRVSDPKSMEEVLQNDRRNNRFFAVDDTHDGLTYQSDGGGWFERRLVTIFLLGKLSKWPDMDGRECIMNEMRVIYRMLLSRLIRDSGMYEQLSYMNTDNISFDEIPGEFAGGTSGLFFTVTVDVPINLEYNESDWQ